MKIVVFGHVCIDQNTSENSSYKSAGGPAVFISKVASFFPDSSVTVVAPYGSDFKEYAGQYRMIPVQPTTDRTLLYFNHTHDGTREQKALNRDVAQPVAIDGIVEEEIRKADIIFVAPLMPNFSVDYIKKIQSLKKESTIITLLPQGYYRNFDAEDNVVTREFAEADDLIWLADVIVVSEQDHDGMSEIAKQWSDKSGVITVVTTGDKGAVAYQRNSSTILETEPLHPSKIVDSVGAGDIFSTAFSYNYASTRDVKVAGEFANKMARQSLFYMTDELKFVM